MCSDGGPETCGGPFVPRGTNGLFPAPRQFWLFDGVLPELNIRTADGAAAHPSVGEAVRAAAAAQSGFTHVLDGRFQSGFITRHYGDPVHDIHAVQLELCQCTY